MKFTTLLPTFAALLISTNVLAASEEPAAEISLVEDTSLFVELDTDKSGTLTTNEVADFGEIKASYKDIDTNSNGEIDADEFAKYENAGEPAVVAPAAE